MAVEEIPVQGPPPQVVGPLGSYDEAAQAIIEALSRAHCFQGWDPTELVWPVAGTTGGEVDLAGLERRLELVSAIDRGMPALRNRRLKEAYGHFSQAAAAYHEGTRIYLRLKKRFVDLGLGDEEGFLHLYQSLLVNTLAKVKLSAPAPGEGVLHDLGLARPPLEHAHRAAQALPTTALDDPRWSECFTVVSGGIEIEVSLLEGLSKVVQRTLDQLAAGDLLATHYNVYSNFAWFGGSVWKVIVEADLLRRRLAGSNEVAEAILATLTKDIRLGEEMLLKFFRAHLEEPAQIRPVAFWYGQPYSYLTRDLIDTVVRVVDRCEQLAGKAARSRLSSPKLPPLLTDQTEGCFLEYPDSGRQGTLSGWQRRVSMARWLLSSWKIGRLKKSLARAKIGRSARLELAWRQWLDWADTTLRHFRIEVKTRIDPAFFGIAQDLDLASGKHKVLFLPTHQSLLDHPVMYRVLSSLELREAMGWAGVQPCVMLARTNLARAGVKFGPWSMTMFGVPSQAFDRLLEEVDGYVTRDLASEAGSPLKRVAAMLDERPAVIYPMATTAAFGTQLFPLQHLLFAGLPQDVIIIPIALRGIHSLWPKIPKGNLNLNPGIVEAVVSPPMLGETTLMPKRRSLRFQLETASLVQAVHITNLLNPEVRV